MAHRLTARIGAGLDGRTFKHAARLLAGAALIALATPTAAAAQAPAAGGPAAAEARAFNIPAQPLAGALNAFGRQAGLQVTVDGAVVAGAQGQAVSGRFTPDEALARLLAGTGMTWRKSGPKTVLLVKAPKPQGVEMLAPVTVEGAAGTAAGAYRYTDLGTAGRTRVGPLGDKDLLETPFSTTAYSADLIKNQQATKLSDVLKNDPSFTMPVTFGSYYDTISLRGFPIGSSGVLFDGLSGPMFGSVFQLESIERVEVLKGPTAFLAGLPPFAGVGGLINLVPKRAEAAPLTSLATGYQSNALFGAHADIARRFGPDNRFGVRFNGVYQDGDTAFDDGKHRHIVAALGLDWQVTDKLRLSSDLAYVDNRHRSYQNSFALADGVPTPNAPDAALNHAQKWTWFQQKQALASFGGEWDFAPGWTAAVKYGYSWHDRTFLSPGNIQILNARGDTRMTATAIDSDYEMHSALATVRGKFDTGPITHEVTAGYSWDLTTYTSAPNRSGGAFLSNLYAPVYAAEPRIAAPGPRRKTLESRANGVSFSDQLSILDGRLSFLAGVRRAMIDYDNFNNVTGAQTLNQKNAKTTPAFAVFAKPTATTMLYANYVQGLELGGTAPATAVNANEVMPAIETRQIEIGAKAEFGGLTATAALFEIEKGYEYLNTSNRYVQDGKQVHRGVEILLSGDVTTGVRLIGGVTLLDPKTKNTGNSATEGKKPIGVSDVGATLYGEYDLPWVEGMTLQSGLYYGSSQYVDATNTQSIPDWVRWDLGLRYTTEVLGNQATLRAGVENVLGNAYWVSASEGSLQLGAPRIVKTSLQMKF